MRLGSFAAVVGALCSSPALYASETSVDVRVKLFAAGTALPEDDAQRALSGTPAKDGNADVRTIVSHRRSLSDSITLTANLDHTVLWVGGDSLGFAVQSPLDQLALDDDRRGLNLTDNFDEGGRHRALHRLDRFNVQLRGSSWGVTLGRQALSLGSGIVFQPLDLFSPFSPTAVDRDYKAGDDMLVIEQLFDNGSDLTWLAVARRDPGGDLTARASSFGAKWRGFVGSAEIELLGGRHIGELVVGGMFRLPIGGALLRSDLLLTRTDEPGDNRWRASGLVNLDTSFDWGGRSAYVFAELFYNGFGVGQLPSNLAELPRGLQRRLSDGELFSLYRRYAAAGLQLQVHPLASVSATLIGNLDDDSSLLSASVTFDASDAQRVQLGVVAPLGGRGDEFGRLDVAPGLTRGGGRQLFVRWVYYL